jgi:hypothetical protein
MKKLAVFVEGLTEQLFVDRFVTAIAGKHAVAIEHRKVTGKRNGGELIRLFASGPTVGQKYFILIVDCSADNRVKSEIRDQYDSLISAGYSAIIGIRDVFPDCSYADLPRLREWLDHGMQMKPFRVTFVLAVMEIETWFICEHTHFTRLDASLTPEYISSNLSFDPSRDDIQQRPTPAADLDGAYRLVGLTYKKERRCLERTLDLLDYGSLYLTVVDRVPDLMALVQALNVFLANYSDSQK